MWREMEMLGQKRNTFLYYFDKKRTVKINDVSFLEEEVPPKYPYYSDPYLSYTNGSIYNSGFLFI